MLGISLSTLRRRMRREAHVLEAQVKTVALACKLQRQSDVEKASEIKDNWEKGRSDEIRVIK